ncbi:MAG: co-chaperone GroES [Planctomycetota bacterium]|nr:co-chaperone GroES [Planctomycetota bacterium]
MATKTSSNTNKKSGTIRPLGDRVLVKRAEAEERTAGGILLPESAKDKPKEGTIVSIGEGRTLDTGEKSVFTVKVNDRILFSAYAGTEVKYGGEEFLIMREEDILGVIG